MQMSSNMWPMVANYGVVEGSMERDVEDYTTLLYQVRVVFWV